MEDDIRRAQAERSKAPKKGAAAAAAGGGDDDDDVQDDRSRVKLTETGKFDTDIYGPSGKARFKGYVSELVEEDEEMDDVDGAAAIGGTHPATREAAAAAQRAVSEKERDDATLTHIRETEGSGLVDTRIANRESEVRSACRTLANNNNNNTAED